MIIIKRQLSLFSTDMLDINLLRNNFEEIKKNLQKKGFEIDAKSFEKLDLEEEPSQAYEEVEAACVAMNEWFACNKLDLWLLSFQTDFTMVFIQRLSELDDASKILEKTGYYDNYTKEDYLNLILTRRRRREDARC